MPRCIPVTIALCLLMVSVPDGSTQAAQVSASSAEQQNQSVTAAASSVQAQQGDVSITAGGNYTQTGSIVMAGPAAQADAATPSGGNVVSRPTVQSTFAALRVAVF